MKKIFLVFIFAVFLFGSTTLPAMAINDPKSVPNNKFGIHIFSEKDLTEAKTLVNSNGGDWGYVTVVITEAERDSNRWQKVFDDMRRAHLIPIIRLATKAVGDSWDAPQQAEINNWIAFLNNLNWVVQNRYVIINNEPNHAQEWGGRVDPTGYATYLKEFSQKLKSASPDFFILPAGLDPSSANTATTMTEDRFLYRMTQAVPDVFNFIDGWTSHAYPNASVSIYEHELLIVDKDLPIFITETGWPNDKYSETQITDNLVNAYKNIWNNPKIIAVTPFILDYTTPPFNIFSWKKADGTFYGFYDKIKSLPKVAGLPTQIESGQILAAFAQPVILNGMDFVGAILAKNNGQTIWNSNNLTIGNESGDFNIKNITLNPIEPTQLGLIFFRAAQTQKNGIYTNSLFIEGTKKQRVTNSFSIEAAITTLDKVQIQGFFDKLLSGQHFLGR